MSDSQEVSFALEHISLAGRRWGQGKSVRVLALHGWLDNCASFYRLAPQLDADIVALDMAGHGKSGRRHTYNIWEDVAEVIAVANQLDWQDFVLLGHSRGAIMSLLIAGTFPERVTKAVFLDGIWPEAIQTESVADQLQSHVTAFLNPARKQATVFNSFDQAVSGRMQGLMPVSRDASEALAERGVSGQGDGFIWHADTRLQLPSAVKLTPEQLQVFTSAATKPSQLYVAEDGIFKRRPELLDRLSAFPQIEPITFSGNHHFHMHEQASVIAESIADFLAAPR